jgi:hypothetical protein
VAGLVTRRRTVGLAELMWPHRLDIVARVEALQWAQRLGEEAAGVSVFQALSDASRPDTQGEPHSLSRLLAVAANLARAGRRGDLVINVADFGRPHGAQAPADPTASAPAPTTLIVPSRYGLPSDPDLLAALWARGDRTVRVRAEKANGSDVDWTTWMGLHGLAVDAQATVGIGPWPEPAAVIAPPARDVIDWYEKRISALFVALGETSLDRVRRRDAAAGKPSARWADTAAGRAKAVLPRSAQHAHERPLTPAQQQRTLAASGELARLERWRATRTGQDAVIVGASVAITGEVANQRTAGDGLPFAPGPLCVFCGLEQQPLSSPDATVFRCLDAPPAGANATAAATVAAVSALDPEDIVFAPISWRSRLVGAAARAFYLALGGASTVDDPTAPGLNIAEPLDDLGDPAFSLGIPVTRLMGFRRVYVVGADAGVVRRIALASGRATTFVCVPDLESLRQAMAKDSR